MRKVIFLGGISLALFVAGLIFFANAGSKNVSATEAVDASLNDKATSCQFSSGASCGCSAEKGTCGRADCPNKNADGSCSCTGKSANGVCGGNSANKNNGSNTGVPKNPSCACQKTAPATSDLK